MTISTEPTPLSYSGNGATTAFPITWKYLAKSHVVATLRNADDTETLWVLDTNYTLTPAGVDAGGTLTALVAPATGTTLNISLDPPNTQTSSFPLGGEFPSTATESALDLSAQRDGKLEALFNRALRVPKTDTQSDTDLELPIDSDRASMLLGFDADGKPIASPGTGGTTTSAFMATVVDDLTSNAALTTLTATRAESGAVAVTVLNKLRERISVKDFGATGDGTTDDRAALALADTAAGAGKTLYFPPGTYKIGSNITLVSIIDLATGGAKLLTATGVTTTLSAVPIFPDAECLTVAGTGKYVLPRQVSEYKALWWGLSTSRNDNEVPINAAITCVDDSSSQNGGVVLIPSGSYNTSAKINQKNRVTIRGVNSRDTEIVAYAAGWGADTYMLHAVNGSSGIFSTRVEQIHFRASGVNAITDVIYSPAYNEQCGIKHVMCSEFDVRGFRFDTGNGGSAWLEIENCEFFPSDVATAASSIHVETAFATAYCVASIRNVTANGGATNKTPRQLYIKGRVNANVDVFHGENCTSVVELETDARGTFRGVTGSPTGVTNVFTYASTITANCQTVLEVPTKGGASVLILDNKNGFTQLANEQVGGLLVYPPDQRIVGNRYMAVSSGFNTNLVMSGQRSLTDNVAGNLIDVTFAGANNKDDTVALVINYMVYTVSGGTLSTEVGSVPIVCSQDDSQNKANTVGTKFGNAQALDAGMASLSVSFAGAFAANIYTITCTSNDANGANSVIFFNASVMGVARPSDTSVALASGVTKAI